MTTAVKIVAVVVIYEEHLFNTATYKSLLAEGHIPFLVYDNSKQAQTFGSIENITYVHDPQNGGVSKAYNKAIIWAKEMGATHLLLLDSDSTFPVNSIEVFEQAALENENTIILPELISSGRKISPFYFYNGKTHYGENIMPGKLELGKKLAINASCILPLAKLEDKHRFNEKLPLDWSDIYFFRKMGRQGLKAVHIPLRVEHGLSDHEQKTFTSAQYRFKLLLDGVVEVGETKWERIQIYFWVFLKAIRLSIRYRSVWFIAYQMSLSK